MPRQSRNTRRWARLLGSELQERAAAYSTFAKIVAPLMQARAAKFSELAKVVEPMVQPMLNAARVVSLLQPYVNAAMLNYRAFHPQRPAEKRPPVRPMILPRRRNDDIGLA